MTSLFKPLPLLCAFTVCAATAAIAFPWDNPSNQRLVLDKTQGKAPLTVTVITPDELAKRWIEWQKGGCRHNTWGNRFWIKWGDGYGEGDANSIAGKPAPFSRTVNLADTGRHNFLAPGKYTVTAQLYEWGAKDEHNVFWNGRTTVTVQAK